MPSANYLYSNAHAAALARLQGLEQVEDPDSIAALEGLGDLSGWHCLEVGAGAGSVARWLSHRVGPNGHVVATDADPRFLEPLVSNSLEVWRHDIVHDALPLAAFDLVHFRHVLIHLAGSAAAALDQLCAALKPGGVLLIEESDFDGATAANTTPPALREIYDTGPIADDS
jgi:SAM-dependent methyltransferase